MAGRGREATLPAWQTQTGVGGVVGQQGSTLHAPAGAPGGQSGWPQGGRHLAPSLQGQPWGRLQRGGMPVHAVQRPHFGGVPGMPPQGFPGQPMLIGIPPGGPVPARPDTFHGPSQQGFSAHGSGSAHAVGGSPQPPSMMGHRQPIASQTQMGASALQPSPLRSSPAGEAPSRGQPAKSVWTEHTAPDGRKYYYNVVTKTSSWTKPAELAQGKNEATRQDVQCDWKEFTAPDGRKYYYNRVTKQSKWQMPEELKQALAATNKAVSRPSSIQVLKLQELSGSSASPALVGAANGIASTPLPVKEETKPGGAMDSRSDTTGALPEPKRPIVYATKEEAKQAFKELLASVGTTSISTWESTMRLIVNDQRYEAFRTIGEKKACFNEYLQQRAKEEKEEVRRRAKQARDDFMILLELSPELMAGTRYSKAAVLFEDEPRWKAIKDSREREQLFNDHMKERDRKEKELRRAEVKKKKAAFRSLLEASKSIKWRKVQGKLEGEDEYEALEKLDRLEVFQSVKKRSLTRDLEKKDAERREREKEQKQRQERQNRDAFERLLHKHREEGTIAPKMRWRDFYAVIANDTALKAVERNSSGSRPRELFEDALEDVEEEYLKHRSQLRELKNFEIQTDTTFSDYNSALESTKEDAISLVPEFHRKLFFEEERGRILEKVAKEEKRKRRAKEDFLHLLRDTRRISHDTNWQQAKGLLEKEPEFKALEEAEREQLYEEHVEKLRIRWEKDKEKERGKVDKKGKRGDDEDKPRKDKKRHKKEKHSDKSAEKKGKDKDRQSKRRHDGSDEDKKSSKRHKRGKSKENGQAAETESPNTPSANKGTPTEGQEASPAAKGILAGSKCSDSEEGEL